MDIEFFEPLKFALEILETDDYLPSIKFGFHVEAKQFTHELEYNGEIWIKCESLDAFLSSLINKKDVSSLVDVDGNIFISITCSNSKADFLWMARRQSITGDIIRSSFEAKVSEDVINAIKESFLSFHKWW